MPFDLDLCSRLVVCYCLFEAEGARPPRCVGRIKKHRGAVLAVEFFFLLNSIAA